MPYNFDCKALAVFFYKTPVGNEPENESITLLTLKKAANVLGENFVLNWNNNSGKSGGVIELLLAA